MLRLAVIAVCAFSFLLAASQVEAQFSNSGVPGAQQGDVHAPWSPSYLPLLPNQPIQYGSSTSINVGVGSGSFYYGNNFPVWGYGYPYGYDSYPYGVPYYPGPVILPPLFLPAETMYGPQAVKRFMGIDGSAPAPRVIIANKSRADSDSLLAKPKVRISNAAMKAQAGKFLAFGDALFFKQNYNSALERYRSAALAAPDLAETYLRQGLALVAMGRYESAAKVIRRALLLQGDPSKWMTRLDDLYKENQVAKTAHLESLASAVEENGQSAELLLLLGTQLFFDGQQDRAAPVFQRCKQLGGNEDGAITEFLSRPPQPAAVNKGRDI